MFINFQTHSKFSNSARQFSPNFSRNDQHNHSSKGRETPQKNLEFSNNSRHNKVSWDGIPRQDESAASPNFTKKKIQEHRPSIPASPMDIFFSSPRGRINRIVPFRGAAAASAQIHPAD
jgi:hypothetical protein